MTFTDITDNLQTEKIGRVYLTGAGPGDPGLLPIRAQDVLSMADTVLYDGLVSDAILSLANPRAELISVSKRVGNTSLTQSEINDLMIRLARAGKLVVRLKCGDPFVFGRGAEEAQALAEAGILWEVIPGVSSGLAAPAYAGIPLTHRKAASSVAFVTGQEDPAKYPSKVDWAKLADSVDTIVVFMGLKQVENIANSLVSAGRPANTPAAVIESGTWRTQRTVTGTLANIAELAADLESPALIVIGDVVEMRSTLNWFEPRLGQVGATPELAAAVFAGSPADQSTQKQFRK